MKGWAPRGGRTCAGPTSRPLCPGHRACCGAASSASPTVGRPPALRLSARPQRGQGRCRHWGGGLGEAMGGVCSWSLSHQLTQPVNPNPNSNRNAKRNTPPVQVLTAPAPQDRGPRGKIISGSQQERQAGRSDPRAGVFPAQSTGPGPRGAPWLWSFLSRRPSTPLGRHGHAGASQGVSRAGQTPEAWHSPAGWAPSPDTVQ